jgi:hypothetical protein
MVNFDVFRGSTIEELDAQTAQMSEGVDFWCSTRPGVTMNSPAMWPPRPTR